MPISDTLNIDLPQSGIKVSVEYYDEEQKKKLQTYPTAKEMDKLVQSGLTVPTEEFLTYYLFHKKRPGKVGWQNYQEVGRKISLALVELDEWVNFTGESICNPQDIGNQDKAITERLGESIGLSVVSRIHKLTAADWDRIKEHPGKKGFSTFDYQTASDNDNIIQVENKGTCVNDNSKKTASVSNHKKDIAEKKSKIAVREKANNYKYPADLRYGTICVMGQSIQHPVKCLLVDPPADGDNTIAQRYRLLLRMRFLRDWVTFISPRSPFAAALQTRLAAIEVLADPFDLDGVQLLRGNGEPFEFSTIEGHSSFFAVKSKVIGRAEGGVVVPLNDGGLFFLGVREELIEQAARQQFSEIISYTSEAEIQTRTVECVLPQSTFQSFRLPDEIKESAIQQAGYFYFQLKGKLFYSSAGSVVGALTMPSTK